MNELLRRMLFLPEQASSIAKDIDHLHYFVILTTLFASFAVGSTALLFFIRYRRRSEHQRTPRIEPRWWIETLFVSVPLVFFLTWFAIGFRDYVRIATPPPDAMDVYVMAKQWMWQFAFPEGPSAIGVLRVPAKRPVRLLMTSRDVIHSFYVPAFRIKQDVLPGRYTQTWFEVEKPGRYQILCAEFCGTSHSLMRGEVEVLKPEEWDAWFQDERRGLALQQDSAPAKGEKVDPEVSMVAQGRRLSTDLGCLRCHTLDGLPHIGPTWLGMYHRREKMQSGEILVADETYITESMMDPLKRIVLGFAPVMPTYRGRVDAAESAAIIEFIKSLTNERLRVEPSKGPVYEPASVR